MKSKKGGRPSAIRRLFVGTECGELLLLGSCPSDGGRKREERRT